MSTTKYKDFCSFCDRSNLEYQEKEIERLVEDEGYTIEQAREEVLTWCTDGVVAKTKDIMGDDCWAMYIAVSSFYPSRVFNGFYVKNMSYCPYCGKRLPEVKGMRRRRVEEEAENV